MSDKGLVPQSRVDGLEEDLAAIDERIIEANIRIDGKQDTITGAASTVTNVNLPDNKVVISNSSGKIAASNISTSELNNLSGSDGNIQTQINTQDTRLTVLENNINDKMNLVTGTEGEVIYFNESDEAFSQTIMNEGFCCLTPEDVELCKNQSPSFRDVFNTWKKFLKSNGYYTSFGMIDERNLDEAWQYGAEHNDLLQYDVPSSIFDNKTVVGAKSCSSTYYNKNKIPAGQYNIDDLYIINSDETTVTEDTVFAIYQYDEVKQANIWKYYDGDITGKTIRGAKDCSASFYDLTKIPAQKVVDGVNVDYELGDIYQVNNKTVLASNGNFAIYTGIDIPMENEVLSKWARLPSICEDVINYKGDLEAWQYDDQLDTIINSRNTAAPNGYISSKKYSSYDITVRCSSTAGDDDTNGLVACCAYDTNGVLHTLSFLRSPYANTNYINSKTHQKDGKRWSCILDYGRFDLKTYPNNNSYQWIIADKTDYALAAYDDPQYNDDTSINRGWNSPEVGIGTVINMTREGNIITAACSQFNSLEIDENTRMTIDLDEMSQTYPILNLFKNSSKWGYTTMSQANSFYENIQIVTPDLYIYDIPNNQVLYFDKSTHTWKADPTKNPYKEIGTGRLSYNSITKKMFYNGGTYITELVSSSSSGEGVTIDGNQVITGSKSFTQSPLVPTPSDNDISTKVATTEFVKRNSSSRNIGEIIQSSIPLNDAGLHLLDGSVIDNGAYSDFVTFMANLYSTNPELFVTETNWQNAVNTYGVCGKFVYNSTNNTVRLPKITGFTEGTLTLNDLGQLTEAGLPNIEGGFGYHRSAFSEDPYGAFTSKDEYGQSGNSTSGGDKSKKVGFDASLSSSIYGNSSTVQPQSIKTLYYIVIATSAKTNIQIDIDQVMTDLNNKVSKNELSTVHVVIESYQNGTDWYRVYDDGWVEQGGLAKNNSSAFETVTLLKPFINTDYTVLLTGYYTAAATATPIINTASKNTSSFQYFFGSSLNTNWYACGQGA